MPLEVDERLKRFECLQGSFETYRSRLDIVLHGGLRHDRPDEIVGEDVRPDLFVNKLGRFASQDIQLHGGLDRSQVEFIIPPRAIQIRQLILGRRLGIEQGRDNDNDLRPEPRLLDAKPSFPNRHEFGERLVCFPIDRAND